MSGSRKTFELSNAAGGSIPANRVGVKRLFQYLKKHLWIVAVVAILSMGALGSALKYLDDNAKRELAKSSKDRSMLSSVNPFMPPPTPAPTVQLSKEYIYAGSRLLAVADAGAETVPPADVAIWRPSNGLWCVLGGTGSAQTIYGWGTNGDVPAPGDYDGDGKTDFAIYRGSGASFWIMKSSDNTYYGVTQGANGDKPVPGDYDGDGKTDTALFRSSNSTWYIVRSSDSGPISTTWGTTGDKPSPADFDGDGKTDLTVWRPDDITFHFSRSSDGVYQGISAGWDQADTPVPADYDGDGKADAAAINGNNWLIKNSSTGVMSQISWQNVGDVPVPNDYDGDGKVDVATWRDSNGNWYIRQSAHNNSLRQVAWGMSGDLPVPAFYRR